MELTKLEEEHIKGYATALQNMMLELTGESSCMKSYDPVDFWGDTLHSYAFDLKDGGRHHPLSDYESVKEICDLMLDEAIDWIVGRYDE